MPEDLLFYDIADGFGIADGHMGSCVLVAVASPVSVSSAMPATYGEGDANSA
jgi:hypothetical protein